MPSRFEALLHTFSGDVFAPPVVVTPLEHGPLASQQLEASPGAKLILEPERHKPAAAFLSALFALEASPQALVVVAPASAQFEDLGLLDTALCHAIPAAQRGEIVALGERSTRGYTGHGAFDVACLPRDNAPVAVTRVQPSRRHASLRSLFQSNHQLWGLGVYVARADVLLAAFKHHASRLFLPVQHASQQAAALGDAMLLDNHAYRRVRDVSFERAVAQQVDNLVAVQVDPSWSLLNDWARDAAEEQAPSNPEVAAWDADLTADQAHHVPHQHAADMMAIYASVAAATEEDGISSRRSSHAWGSRETLAMGPGFSLQRLIVNPGASVTLSAGAGTPEHWVVVQGAALLTLGQQVRMLWESQSARIPAGRDRRIENPGSGVLQLVQLNVSALNKGGSATGTDRNSSPAGVA
ncbi:mannose-6-phosphate isomerase [Phaeobacter sp. HF9A]|uniref:mannose-6-phosphate isomerase n=1 Tax=Phaeobacter sp. HF9A TaxID=2721561 RepID=UPI0034C5D0A2